MADVIPTTPELEEESVPRKSRRGLIGLIVLFMLVIAAGVFLYFTIRNDWGGVRTNVIAWVNRFDPDYKSIGVRLSELESEELRIEGLMAELEGGQKKLEADQKRLAESENAVKQREISVAEQEVFIKPLYLRGLNDDKVNELKQLGRIYQAMDPQDAARIMAQLYDVTHVAAIIYYMNAASAAEVLSELSTNLAASVTSELLRY